MNEVKWYKNFRFWILIGITIIFLLLSGFVFRDSYIRLFYGIKQFGLTMAYYFCELFMIPHKINPNVNSLPISEVVPTQTTPSTDVPSVIIPSTSDNFKIKWDIYFSSCWNLETFGRYTNVVFNGLSDFCRILLIVLPIFFVLWLLFKRYFAINTESEDDKESKPLFIFKRVFVYPFNFVKNIITETKNYYKEHSYFSIIWLVLWLINFNIISIFVGFLSFYFWFVITLDFQHIYFQFYKLFVDLKVIPIWLIIIFVLVWLHKTRIKLAYSRLDHYENRNRGFLNSLGLVVLISGVTGKGKTLMMTDLTLSQEVMFRDKCFEKILENDLKFKNFNWNIFESELKNAISHHQIYTIASCEVWVNKKRCRFEMNPCKEKIFGYDFYQYGLFNNNGLVNEYIFDVLKEYAKLYFVYVIESSLIISNYGIRVDNILESAGHFPMWNNDFFRKDLDLSEAYSRHSHIIDFDMLRLGKRFVAKNPLADSVEFGVFAITEIDKERGNQLTNQVIKADSDEANPKNDYTELCEKIERHSATIDNYPFMRIFMDSQRALSLGADSREIAEKIVHIRDIGETKNALFGFWFDEMIYDFFRNKFEKYYYRYRFARSDNTLFMYLLKNICGYFINSYYKKVNNFGYAIASCQTEKSTLDGDFESIKWYRINKKIYSNRYKSNCFKDYFYKKALKSSVGLDDIREYQDTEPSMDEYNLQHSYFIDKLNEVMDNNIQVDITQNK